MRINHRDPRPIFRQISDTLREDIRSGALKSGVPIPSEREYAEKLRISRMTVRAAINELVAEGLLVRKPGRATTVSTGMISKSTQGFMSFTEDMQLRGMSATSRLLNCHEETADASVAAQFGLSAGSRIIVLERLRLADEQPMALEHVQLPQRRFAGIQQHDLQTLSLYAVMEREYHAVPRMSDESIEAVSLTAHEAALLGVAQDRPALLARRVTRDAEGHVLEVVKTVYRGDRYRMVFTRNRS
jgi:GntR family transcriptional regulator